MGKSEQNQKYELVMIVDSRLGKSEKDAVVQEAKDIVAKADGKVINSQVWLEKQRFSYPIEKCSEGTYYLMNVEGGRQLSNKIRPNLRLKENVLRFLIMSHENSSPIEAAKN